MFTSNYKGVSFRTLSFTPRSLFFSFFKFTYVLVLFPWREGRVPPSSFGARAPSVGSV